jgi:hypothetical protein
VGIGRPQHCASGAYSGYGLAGTNARHGAVLRINYFLKEASAIVLKGYAKSDFL